MSRLIVQMITRSPVHAKRKSVPEFYAFIPARVDFRESPDSGIGNIRQIAKVTSDIKHQPFITLHPYDFEYELIEENEKNYRVQEIAFTKRVFFC